MKVFITLLINEFGAETLHNFSMLKLIRFFFLRLVLFLFSILRFVLLLRRRLGRLSFRLPLIFLLSAIEQWPSSHWADEGERWVGEGWSRERVSWSSQHNKLSAALPAACCPVWGCHLAKINCTKRKITTQSQDEPATSSDKNCRPEN